MRIRDNGVGFDLEKGSNGIGLHNIETRQELVNGKMLLQAAPVKGWQLDVYLPQ